MNVQFWIGGADSLLKLCSMVLDFGKAAGYAKSASMLKGVVMQGFESRWKDFPDYILGITKEIWEDRCIGPKVRQYYGEDVIVRMPGGISTGAEATISATAATLNEFPDRVLLGEDVIWSGTPEDGMLSSHRIFSTATHLADGAFGTATGRAVATRAIADCYAKDGVITDEWLVRDNGGLVRQIGQDPRAWAAKKVDAGHRAFDPSQNIVPGINQENRLSYLVMLRSHTHTNPHAAFYHFVITIDIVFFQQQKKLQAVVIKVSQWR